MAIIDIIVLIIIALSLLVGWTRGFIKEAMSIVSWGIALFLAYLFSKPVGQILAGFLPLQNPIDIIAGFIIVLVATLVIASIVTYLLSSLIESIGIKSIDRGLGAFFGVIRGVVLIAIFILFSINMKLTRTSWYEASIFIPRINPVAEAIYNMLPNNISEYFSQTETAFTSNLDGQKIIEEPLSDENSVQNNQQDNGLKN